MIELYLTNALKVLFLPPGGILLLLFVGLLLLKSKPVLAKLLLWLSLILGYLLSTPLVAGLLQQQLQTYPALSEAQIKNSQAQAIVVLSAGRYKHAPEYGGDTADNNTLVRLRYGAYLQRLTGLPIVVSGGYAIDTDGKSLAQVMADSLQNDFRLQQVWQEDKSRTTAENAALSKQLLADKGIDTIFLVSHASDMPRAVAIFEQAGLKVIAAPTRFAVLDENLLFLLLPRAASIEESYHALYEMVGRLWYAIRY